MTGVKGVILASTSVDVDWLLGNNVKEVRIVLK